VQRAITYAHIAREKDQYAALYAWCTFGFHGPTHFLFREAIEQSVEWQVTLLGVEHRVARDRTRLRVACTINKISRESGAGGGGLNHAACGAGLQSRIRIDRDHPALRLTMRWPREAVARLSCDIVIGGADLAGKPKRICGHSRNPASGV